METKYYINGREYQNLEEIPHDLLKLFADEDKNGVPDIFEGKIKFGDFFKMIKTVATRKIIVNGKEYKNLTELPPEVKQHLREKLESLNREINSPSHTARPQSFDPPASPLIGGVTQNTSSNLIKLWIALIGLLVVILATIIILFPYFRAPL